MGESNFGKADTIASSYGLTEGELLVLSESVYETGWLIVGEQVDDFGDTELKLIKDVTITGHHAIKFKTVKLADLKSWNS